MSNFKLNHWFINGNELSISLMRYYVDINMNLDDYSGICFILRVIDSNRRQLLFNFDSIEKAVVFTETVIDKCLTFEEIKEAYNKYYSTDIAKTFIKKID